MPAPEPRTHYQVSFTSRQAVLLFVVVLVSLAGAYFLGLLTGLSGRQPGDGVAAAVPASSPTAVEVAAAGPATDTEAALPTPAQDKAPIAPAPAPPTALAARDPQTAGGLEFFEDRPDEGAGSTPASPAKKAAAPAGMAGGWWVQILATSSEREARSRRAALLAHGYHAAVEPVRGSKGPTQYRVRVGPYASRDDAGRAKEVLARKEKAIPWIVPPGQ